MHNQWESFLVCTALVCVMTTLRVQSACVCEGAFPALMALYNATDGAHWVDPWVIHAGGATTSVCGLSGVTCYVGGFIALDLSNRSLTGTIPDHFPVLYPHVHILALTNNSLRGTLPASMSLYGATIYVFDVEKNAQLTGTLPPEFQNWTRLARFSATDCHFIGTLPRVYARWGDALQTFEIESNGITGPFPVEYQNWTSLRILKCSNNHMSGTFPTEVFKGWGGHLDEFLVDSNAFVGDPLSETLCSEAKVLSVIHVQHNQFTGTIPACLAQITTMKRLALGNNSYSGTIPSSLSSMSLLSELDVSFNQLVGTLPPELSRLTAMSYFMAQGNRLTGTLPPQYAAWLRMTSFLVDSNLYLTGSLPESYAAWGDSIEIIRVSMNNFSGSLPQTWGNAFTRISALVFSRNRISGTIPASYSGMTRLTMLGLDSNQLSGTLPSSWQTLSILQGLSLNNNSALEGPIPSSWSAMRKLMVFVICDTNICGNASTFPLLPILGFTCPPSSVLDAFDQAQLIAYALTAAKVFSVDCRITTTTNSPNNNGSVANTDNTSASVLPYTTIATSAGNAAVWSVVATQGLHISGASHVAASVAFLQGAFAASRLRRRCSANSSALLHAAPHTH
jgi:hypothetical protein